MTQFLERPNIVVSNNSHLHPLQACNALNQKRQLDELYFLSPQHQLTTYTTLRGLEEFMFISFLTSLTGK